MTVTPEELAAFSRLIGDLSGIVLDETKGYLIEHRLGAVVRDHGLSDLAELYHRVRYDHDAELTQIMIDAITTNETLFFRDTSPYEALQNKVFPHLFDQLGTQRRLRIWSAACSSGQEPYSIAMTLRDLIPDVDAWNISILASDISNAVVAKASRGVYAEHEIKRGMNADRLARYFRPHKEGWKVTDEVRAMVEFRKFNLHDPMTTMGGPFDIIFCRNVAIYFSDDDRQKLFARLTDRLAPHGSLFIGAQESLDQFQLPLIKQRHCRCLFYCGPESGLLVA